MPELPRLLYIADVPVESSQHGSALMFRALEHYPVDRLRIVETGLASQPERRLPKVTYLHEPLANRRWLDSRAHGFYSAWALHRAPSRASQIVAALDGFAPEAIMTVGHGFGWVTAARAADILRRPLHFVVHDDWPRLSAITRLAQGSLERSFGRIYRGAASRLCISPSMSEEYERRYGGHGRVMYPSRSATCRPMAAKPARAIAKDAMVIGYGGNSGPDMMTCLRTLASVLDDSGARLAVFGPFDAGQQQELLSLSNSINFHGFVPFERMVAELREMSDVLFVPMTFDAEQRENMVVSFPSKLADYTATGVPLLVYGPSYSSVVRWVEANDGVAELVTAEGGDALRSALLKLRGDDSRRGALARRSVTVGAECFGPERAGAALSTALAGG